MKCVFITLQTTVADKITLLILQHVYQLIIPLQFNSGTACKYGILYTPCTSLETVDVTSLYLLVQGADLLIH